MAPKRKPIRRDESKSHAISSINDGIARYARALCKQRLNPNNGEVSSLSKSQGKAADYTASKEDLTAEADDSNFLQTLAKRGNPIFDAVDDDGDTSEGVNDAANKEKAITTKSKKTARSAKRGRPFLDTDDEEEVDEATKSLIARLAPHSLSNENDSPRVSRSMFRRIGLDPASHTLNDEHDRSTSSISRKNSHAINQAPSVVQHEPKWEDTSDSEPLFVPDTESVKKATGQKEAERKASLNDKGYSSQIQALFATTPFKRRKITDSGPSQ